MHWIVTIPISKSHGMHRSFISGAKVLLKIILSSATFHANETYLPRVKMSDYMFQSS